MRPDGRRPGQLKLEGEGKGGGAELNIPFQPGYTNIPLTDPIDKSRNISEIRLGQDKIDTASLYRSGRWSSGGFGR